MELSDSAMVQPGPAPNVYASASAGSAMTSFASTAGNAHSRFAPPKSNKEIQEARNKGKPKKTIEDTQYCVKVRQKIDKVEYKGGT